VGGFLLLTQPVLLLVAGLPAPTSPVFVQPLLEVSDDSTRLLLLLERALSASFYYRQISQPSSTRSIYAHYERQYNGGL